MRSDFFLSPTLICNPPVIAAVFKPLSSGFGKISKKQTVVMKTTVDWCANSMFVKCEGFALACCGVCTV